MSGWRYIAQQLPDGAIIDPNLPLSGVEITDALSGPGGLSGTIPVEVGRLKGPDGEPLLKEWGAAIWAEADGVIRGGGIVDVSQPSGPEWRIECVGFSGYLQGLPYVGDGWVGTRVDPLDVVRRIWDHAQSFPDGNLGVLVDQTTSPIRIGEEQYVAVWTEQAGSDTTFDDGPIRLNWWDVHDLGAMIDGWAGQGYFDYHEETSWKDDRRRELVHRLRLHYPQMGRRRDDLRFVVGENIAVVPETQLVEEGYASEVMFLGAGEGREKVQALAGGPTGRLRRVAVVVDDTVKRQTDARNRANAERAKRLGYHEVKQIQVREHSNAPVGSWQVGDEIRVQGKAGWVDLDMWLRITASTISPESGDVATLTLARGA